MDINIFLTAIKWIIFLLVGLAFGYMLFRFIIFILDKLGMNKARKKEKVFDAKIIKRIDK